MLRLDGDQHGHKDGNNQSDLHLSRASDANCVHADDSIGAFVYLAGLVRPLGNMWLAPTPCRTVLQVVWSALFGALLLVQW